MVDTLNKRVDTFWKQKQWKKYRPRVTWKNGGLLDPELAPNLFRTSEDQVNLSVEDLLEFYMNNTQAHMEPDFDRRKKSSGGKHLRIHLIRYANPIKL